MRILIAILLVALGAFPVLLHNNFSFSQMSPVEVAIFIACLIAAALLILVKKIPSKSKEEDSLYQMKFTLSSPSPIVQQSQQLYLASVPGDRVKLVIGSLKEDRPVIIKDVDMYRESAPDLWKILVHQEIRRLMLLPLLMKVIYLDLLVWIIRNTAQMIRLFLPEYVLLFQIY